MNKYDPLDWIHQWDDYEMMMYARSEADGDPGIFMQVSQKVLQDGAEAWEIIYDRKIADLFPVDDESGTDMWEEQLLRRHLNAHPALVNDEKAYLAQFLDGSHNSV